MKKKIYFCLRISAWRLVLCIYADTLKEAEEMFWRQMTEFVEITKVECE